MDGNNRWSKKNKLNKYNGYKKGANTLIKISNYIFNNTDAKFISAFALSKNNLSRSNNLISTLKKILLEFIDNVIEEKTNYNFNIRFIGNRNFLTTKINNKIDQLENLKKNYKKSLLIYINYSGKNDIQQAALNFNLNSKLQKSNIKFSNFLMTAGIPDPDMLVRTGGFKRLSDFLIFQSSFTELFFLKKLWPDLNTYDLKRILMKYKTLERKFGL